MSLDEIPKGASVDGKEEGLRPEPCAQPHGGQGGEGQAAEGPKQGQPLGREHSQVKEVLEEVISSVKRYSQAA